MRNEQYADEEDDDGGGGGSAKYAALMRSAGTRGRMSFVDVVGGHRMHYAKQFLMSETARICCCGQLG